MKKNTIILFIFVFVFLCQSLEYDNIRSYIIAGDYGKALDIINSEISEDSKNRILFEMRGDVFFKIEEFSRALDDYKAAYRLSFTEEHKLSVKQKYNKVLDSLYELSLSKFHRSENIHIHNIDLLPVKESRKGEIIEFHHGFIFEQVGRKTMGPRSFTVAGDNIYVIDNMDYKICIFDMEGELLSSFGEKGLSEGRLFRPADIAVSDNKIFIADMYRNIIRLICFGDNGDFLWEKKITELDQIDQIKTEDNLIYVNGVKDKHNSTIMFDLNGNIKGVKNTFYEDLTVDRIKGNIISINENTLNNIYNINYPENTFTRGLIFADKDIFILSVKVLRDKKEREYNYDQIIYFFDYSGNIKKTVKFDSALFGNLDRSRKYFYDNVKNYLYISNIENNKFNVLKFKGF